MAYRFTPADRGAFKRCRRQWDFGARERQNYEPDRPAAAPDGRPVRYQGRVDLLAGDEHDRYWVVAHRVVDRFGSDDELLLDEELVAACWAVERFYPGMRVAAEGGSKPLSPPAAPPP